jgi:very-short-patch-repair endonuclease
VKYGDLEIKKCPYCDNNVGLRRYNPPKLMKTCGSIECKSKELSNRTFTQETIEILRRKRFEYLKKKSGKTAWERRSSGEMSFLEKWFFDDAICMYELYKKFDIIYDYPIYPYFIDFAFLNIKLAVELDGKCHFKNGIDRLNHDIEKDNLLIENGWKIYRIKYTDKNTESILKFLSYIKMDDIPLKNFENKLYRYSEIKIKKKTRNRSQYFEDRKNKTNEFYIPYINLILNSGINFSVYGWVSKTSEILNISPQKVTGWMKRFMPEFYENECFKRK